jgi:hypothetical protein
MLQVENQLSRFEDDARHDTKTNNLNAESMQAVKKEA